MGNEVFLYLVTGEHHLHRPRRPAHQAKPGHKIRVLFDLSEMHAFDPETEQAIAHARSR